MSLYGCTKCVTNEAGSLLQCEECHEITKHVKTEEDYKPDMSFSQSSNCDGIGYCFFTMCSLILCCFQR
jgi:hypothetical protein